MRNSELRTRLGCPCRWLRREWRYEGLILRLRFALFSAFSIPNNATCLLRRKHPMTTTSDAIPNSEFRIPNSELRICLLRRKHPMTTTSDAIPNSEFRIPNYAIRLLRRKHPLTTISDAIPNSEFRITHLSPAAETPDDHNLGRNSEFRIPNSELRICLLRRKHPMTTISDAIPNSEFRIPNYAFPIPNPSRNLSMAPFSMRLT